MPATGGGAAVMGRGPLGTVRLYWETLRWLRPIQAAYRVRRAVQRRTDPVLFPRRLRRALERDRPGISERARAGLAVRPVPGSRSEAHEILEGRFTFANETVICEADPPWGDADPARRFWNYNLHYFEYAVALAEAYRDSGNDEALVQCRRLMESWIARNPPGAPIAWDGGPLSHRIVNWCLAAAVAPELLEDAPFRGRFAESLYAQAMYLEEHLEYHLCANHLVTNAKALLFAGFFLTGDAPELRWRVRGERMLWEELREQVLPDGGHYERSPMYHAIVLQDALESVALLRALERRVSAEAEDALRRMLAFLEDTLHGDGEIALMNDAAFGMARPAREVIRYGRALLGARGGAPADSLRAFPDTGLYVFEASPRCRLIFDAGPVGPDYNPGHAHGDTLSFELSIGAQRVITDSGTFGYNADAMRAYCESTRAHNTVQIDGAEQIEKWGPYGFRCARRARPVNVSCSDGRVTAGHTGFDHLPGSPRHTRQIRQEGGCWIVIDEIRGGGTHALESRLHLHPFVFMEGEGGGWRAKWPDGALHIQPFGAGACLLHDPLQDPPEGWYCPEFNVRLPRHVLITRYRGPLPVCMGWLLVPNSAPGGAPAVRLDGAPPNVVLEIRVCDEVRYLRPF